jgi:predicted RNA-binding Zn ribbon-like protein
MSVEQRPLVGGHVLLDLVNTVAWRLDPARIVDDVSTADALVAWMRRTRLLHGELADVDAKSAAKALERGRRLREDLYRVLIAAIERQPPPSDAVEALRRSMLGALSRARITTMVPLRWEFVPADVTDLPVLIALEAWRFLQFTDLTRLRHCADEGCGWLFLDTSRNGSRRWCSSADCGNRARARRHYHRTRS